MTTAPNPSYQHLLLTIEDRLAYITMNRPARRNALSLEHMEELIDAFRTVGRRGDVGAVVLAGAGPAFCAGHDLSEMSGRSPEFYRQLFDICTVLMETIQEAGFRVTTERLNCNVKVYDYNLRRGLFPANVVALVFGFKERPALMGPLVYTPVSRVS